MEARAGRKAAERHRVRIIAPDRPGFGLSDFQRGRTLLDWPDDVACLADELGIDRFAVLGVSGGGPYALACAYRIPERLGRVAVVACVAPADSREASAGMAIANRVVFGLASRAPWLMRPSMELLARAARRNPRRLQQRRLRSLPEPDRLLVEAGELDDLIQVAAAEAFRSGGRGAAWEGRLAARPWGFRLEDVAPQVHLFQGELDVQVPPAMGRYLASVLPDCKARFYPDLGHLSLAVGHLDDVLEALTSDARAA